MPYYNPHNYSSNNYVLLPTWQTIDLPISKFWRRVSGGFDENNNPVFVGIATDGATFSLNPNNPTVITVNDSDNNNPLYVEKQSSGYEWAAVTYGKPFLSANNYPEAFFVKNNLASSASTPIGKMKVGDIPSLGTMAGGTYYGAVFDGSKIVAYGTNVTVAFIKYSNDGVNWSQTVLPESYNFTEFNYKNGTYVITNNGDKCYVSNDGINWTLLTLPINRYFICSAITTTHVYLYVYASNEYVSAPIADLFNNPTWTIGNTGVVGNWYAASTRDDTIMVFAYGSPYSQVLISQDGYSYVLENTVVNTLPTILHSFSFDKYVAAVGFAYQPTSMILLGTF